MAESLHVVITATRETLVRQPGRYAHCATQHRTDYAAYVLGKSYRGHNNLATLKTLIRQQAFRAGISRVTFVVD